MKKHTRFIDEKRQLVISGLPRHYNPSAELLLDLLDHGLLEDTHLQDHRRSQTLTLVLARRGNLLPADLLRGVAHQLSQHSEHRAVYDPWTIGGRPVNVNLAASMIGDVIRATMQPRVPALARR